jgi:predicted phage terminase large subunit-like protein
MHGHIIVIDDPINPKAAVSKVQLKSANDWFDHTLMTRKVSKALTPTFLVMQRLHQSDPTGHILGQWDRRRIRHICLPATLTPHVRPRALRHQYTDGLFDPARLPKKVLEEARMELGEYAYAGQYLQSPVPMGGGMFRVDCLQIIPHAPRLVRVVRYWDKAGTSKGGAFTVGVKMGLDVDGRFVVLDVRRGQWEAAERERIIRQTTVMDGKAVEVVVEQEPGSGGKESAQNTLKNLAGFRVILDRPVGDKELRADPFAVQVNGGNVVILHGEWNARYVDELQFFPFSTYKDQVDGSSGAFARLSRTRRKVGAL